MQGGDLRGKIMDRGFDLNNFEATAWADPKLGLDPRNTNSRVNLKGASYLNEFYTNPKNRQKYQKVKLANGEEHWIEPETLREHIDEQMGKPSEAKPTEVTPAKEPTPAPPDAGGELTANLVESGTSLESFGRDTLSELAEYYGVDVPKDASRGEIIDAIKERKPAEAPAEAPTKEQQQPRPSVAQTPIEGFKSNLEQSGIPYLKPFEFKKSGNIENWENEGGIIYADSYLPTARIGNTSIGFSTEGMALNRTGTGVLKMIDSDVDKNGNKNRKKMDSWT
jgi:hypothetical protein